MEIYSRERNEKRLECIPSVVGKVLSNMKPFIYEIGQELYWINGNEFWICNEYEEIYKKYRHELQKLINIKCGQYKLCGTDVANLVNTFEEIVYDGKTQVQAQKDSDGKLFTLIKPLKDEDLSNIIEQIEDFRDVSYIKDEIEMFS